MIITRTPFRLSFFGGGTDLETFYSKTDGKVLSIAIDKYIYVVVKKKIGIVEHKYRINWSTVEFTNNINQIKNPIARECLKYFKIDYPVEITTFADVPANTGLGSSSAFAVGLVNALFALEGKLASKYEIASIAAKIEIDILGRKIGKQDHYACCYGNLNNFVFKKDDTVVINPIPASNQTIKKLEKNMILFFTNQKRNSETILKKQHSITKNQFIILKQMRDLVEVSKNLILNKNFDIKTFGKLLDKNWHLKKQSNKFVSNNLIEKIYKDAIDKGAYGGKLLGAGNGGFLLFIANQFSQKKRIRSLKKYGKMYIRLDYSGTRITYYDKSGEENVR
jgi:D-glycero-alpha-D-manno-heptose-7-phosphate kinase